MTPAEIRAWVAEQRAVCDAATEGPWAWWHGEKDYFAGVGARCYAESDEKCTNPLEGNLTPRDDDYYVDETVAESHHQNALSDAEFTATARTGYPRALDLLEELLAENARLRSDIDQCRGRVEGAVEKPDHTCPSCGSADTIVDDEGRIWCRCRTVTEPTPAPAEPPQSPPRAQDQP